MRTERYGDQMTAHNWKGGVQKGTLSCSLPAHLLKGILILVEAFCPLRVSLGQQRTAA